MTASTAQWKNAKDFLDYLNTTYAKIHTTYENFFWTSFMGDHTVNEKKDKAQNVRDAFRSNETLKTITEDYLLSAKGEIKERLEYWNQFFSLYQTPQEAKEIKQKITAIETKLESFRSTREEGYIDPKTKKFVKSSTNAMRGLSVTNSDEAVRKACFEAMGKLGIGNIPTYIELVNARNAFAHILGYEDFYAYKLFIEEGMTKKELFDLFDTIYEKTKYAFDNIRALEKTRPGIRKPWNYSYMFAGSFIKEEDQYFPIETIVERWGQSFSALGISYQGSRLVFDLLDRDGKYNNGFCHWPELITFKDGKRIPGRSQLTCNIVVGVPGQSDQGLDTLFHEGGHAAHMLNTEMKDVCVNHEYAPMSTAWAETQSMFLDTIVGSIEWVTRYAKNAEGQAFPFDIYRRKVEAMHIQVPLGMMGIMRVSEFEKHIYETKNLTEEKVIAISKKMSKKYTDFAVDSHAILEVPHIYAWENACGYHAYGLAQLGLAQWRDYFFTKYGYIVDNPNIGKEMKKVWKYGGSKTFPEFIVLATGKKLSATPYIKNVTRSISTMMKNAKDRIAYIAKKPLFNKPIDLNASISLVHGKQVIATNKKSFEDMSKKYATWLQTQKKQ